MVMLRRGATAIWEAWDGISADGTPKDSLDHYSKGAGNSSLDEYTAGLRGASPGWARFTVRPVPGGGLARAEVIHDSPQGRIASAWTIEDGRFRLRVTVPSSSIADVELPDGARTTVRTGAPRFSCAWPADAAAGLSPARGS